MPTILVAHEGIMSTKIIHLFVLFIVKACEAIDKNFDTILEPLDNTIDVNVKHLDNFNIDSVDFTKEPLCDIPVYLTIMIHSKPSHQSLRNTLRQTWASNQKVVKTRTVFVVGKSLDHDLETAIDTESKEHGDILQGDFIDSYRNMTYKHLLVYKWISDSCDKTEFVLKTDDDQFVDIFHLPRYLQEFARKEDKFFLCQVQNMKPQREEGSKWFVTAEEFGEEKYPLYCAGWAYVTTVPTIKQLLDVSRTLPYFWIDDVHVTGILRNLASISFFDWGPRFLNQHVQYSQKVLEGTFYTPELMVCGDVTEQNIRHLYGKASKMHTNKQAAMDMIYKDDKERQLFIPRKIEFKVKKERREEL